MKLFVIAAMHGDEVFGLKIIGALQESHSPRLVARVGHPEAIAKRRRFIESDLNRSFAVQNKTKESQIARSIQTDIDRYKPKYILDIHTSVSNVKKVAIVAQLSDDIKRIATELGMEAIVQMPQDIAAQSLIGCYPAKALSLEFGKYQRSDKLAASIAKNITELGRGHAPHAKNIPVFRVTGTIPKNHRALHGIKNLTYNSDLQGYPFLAGENTYETIGGFVAIK